MCIRDSPDCDDITEDDDKDIAIALFNAHVSTHSARGAPTPQNRAERLQRPKISQGMLEENWNSFLLQWGIYKDGAGLQAAELRRWLWFQLQWVSGELKCLE